MKPRTVILPFLLPRLSDAGAAQLVAALQTLFESVAHHYAGQVHQHHRRVANRQYRGYTAPVEPSDPPF
jgi:hypothetical protein